MGCGLTSDPYKDPNKLSISPNFQGADIPSYTDSTLDMADSGRPNVTADRRSYLLYEGCPEPAWYTHLEEPELTSKLKDLAQGGTIRDTDYVTLQPCTNPEDASQDRFVVQDWDIRGRVWRFRAVFDGHGGHETVDYTHEHLPPLLRERLTVLVENKTEWEPSDVSRVLEEGISTFDNDIGRAFLNLFPLNAVNDLRDEEVTAIVNDPANLSVALRCMRGTTALVSLVDPDTTNLWVVSLGDCSAVLGIKEANGVWTTQSLSFDHNGLNEGEVKRIASEHPGEEACVSEGRVLGAIAVTRAIGDFQFKFSAPYIERGLLNVATGFRVMRRVQDYLSRVLTPPYVSNIPQASHVSLPANPGSEVTLLMCSDGLTDLYNNLHGSRQAVMAPGFWNGIMDKAMAAIGGDIGNESNSAMRILRQGLGGDDLGAVSKALTTEFQGRWMDDTTVLVVRL